MRARLEKASPWIVGVLALGAGVFFMWAARDGSIHGYYSPAAYAMSENLHNFVYGAVDSSGWAGLDKIPGSLWPQAISVRLLGYHWWSVILPVVLATMGTIALLYLTVARWLGRPAGLLAALMYATTPVVAVCAQVNVPEAWLALAFVATAYCTLRAAGSASLLWLVGAGLAIAAGFQAKMLQSWSIWPAVILVYLMAAPARGLTRIWHLLVAGAVSLAASLWWVVLVTMTPAAGRPYVGGSDTDSAWEMVFGYNGLGRFGWWSGRSFVVDMGGAAGLERVIGAQVSVDLAWLIPLAIMGLVAGIVVTWKRPGAERAGWVFFGAFLVSVSAPIIFSSGIHTFYILAYAPAVAALAAGAFVLGWHGLAAARSARWLVLGALAIEIAWTAWLVARSQEFGWLLWASAGLGLAAGALVLLEQRTLGITLALAAVLLAPLTWSISTLGPTNSINPTAYLGAMGPGGAPGSGMGSGMGPGMGPGSPGGPPPQAGPGGAPAAPPAGPPADGMGGRSEAQLAEAAAWLMAHQSGAPYLVAADSDIASSLVVAGVPGVLTMGGGFQGSDPTPTVEEFAGLVAGGDLTYVVSIEGRSGGPGGGGPANNALAGAEERAQRNAWIAEHCSQLAQAPTGILACSSSTSNG